MALRPSLVNWPLKTQSVIRFGETLRLKREITVLRPVSALLDMYCLEFGEAVFGERRIDAENKQPSPTWGYKLLTYFFNELILQSRKWLTSKYCSDIHQDKPRTSVNQIIYDFINSNSPETILRLPGIIDDCSVTKKEFVDDITSAIYSTITWLYGHVIDDILDNEFYVYELMPVVGIETLGVVKKGDYRIMDWHYRIEQEVEEARSKDNDERSLKMGIGK